MSEPTLTGSGLIEYARYASGTALRRRWWCLLWLNWLWPVLSWGQQEPQPVNYWHINLVNLDGTTLVWLFAVLLILALFPVMLYRLLLKSQVQKGLHPHLLSWTLILFFSITYLLVTVSVLYHLGNIGLGIFTLIAFILILIPLIMLILGKVMNLLWLFVLVATAIILFQLFNPVVVSVGG
jgi:hypothetical protein